MTDLDFSRCRTAPMAHQRVGAARIFSDRVLALLDEMGAGKTKQAIDGACFLRDAGEADLAIVLAPSAVRPVWSDPELGEIAAHAFGPTVVSEFHSKGLVERWRRDCGPGGPPPLQWIVTNYEFARDPSRRDWLVRAAAGRRAALFCDESTALKSWSSAQTRAAIAIRARCRRAVIMTGTPIADTPMDLFSQMWVLDPAILACRAPGHFKNRYATLGGFHGKEILEWKPEGIAEIQALIAPYALRRMKSDCMDLPEKIPSVIVEAPMTPAAWDAYRSMRDELVAWLSENEAASATTAGTKVTRLAQICAGFVGGVQTIGADGSMDFAPGPGAPIRRLGTWKQDALFERIAAWQAEDRGLKQISWCRFRAELECAAEAFAADQRFAGWAIGTIAGSQRKADREAARRLLDPRTAPAGPAHVLGIAAAGGMGLNLTASHTMAYLSNSFRLLDRAQSEDRVHRKGQRNPCSYFDVVATGPRGQRTMDHHVIKATRAKADLAAFTASAWRRALEEG